ncbi:MAG: hypothetical protein M3Z41_06815, partial [Candidatus Eremiobacteraeota bacterium]|nr:hypothetical protein [Candidatus Eremiobacteraeota bacterium]
VMEPPVFYRSQWVLSAAVLETIAQPTYNRWDAYYFGYLQQRPAIRDSLQFRTDGATLYFEATWPGEYDIYLRLETGPTIEPVAVSVDGDAYECKDPRSPTDRTEDVIAVNQKWLQAGMHTVQLARCLSGRAVGKLAVFGIDVVPVVFLVPAADRPTIVDLKQAPGSFRVALKGGDPTYLVLNDAYDNRWVARQNGEILAHRLANGYANAWFIKNPQAGSVDVYFAPQGLLNIGYATSAGAFGILLILGVFVGRSWHRRQLS